MSVHQSVLELIGRTPVIRAQRLDAGPCELYLKLESHNPGGSIKDRIGLSMIAAAEKAGKIQPGATLVEGTAGNTGIGLALVAQQKGYKLVLVVPDSRHFTWDVVRGGFGADVAFIDAALSHAFARCQIDPARVGMGGFSDGASYALSLGLTNGDLVTHVLAFSPGFMDPGEPRGRPHIRITHGTRDAILPIDLSRRWE